MLYLVDECAGIARVTAKQCPRTVKAKYAAGGLVFSRALGHHLVECAVVQAETQPQLLIDAILHVKPGLERSVDDGKSQERFLDLIGFL